MKNLTARQRIFFGVWAMIPTILGDYLLGINAFRFSKAPEAYKGMVFAPVADWRLALSALLGVGSVALFAVGAVELLRVMERKYGLGGKKLFRIFQIANWSAIVYFAFLHVSFCILLLVRNAGMAATGNPNTATDMMLQVAKGIIIPHAIAFLLCDGLVTVSWIGMVWKGMLPLKKIALICNPLTILFLGGGQDMILGGMYSNGYESLGWLLMYLVCAMKLVEERER